MKVVTPQHEKLVELAEPKLDEYLSREGLVVKRSKMRDVGIAFPREMECVVDDAINAKIRTVSYRNLRQLRTDVESALEESEIVGFAPGQREMRDFYDTQGFCKAMSTLSTQIENGEVVVPPGLYGTTHLIVWTRRKEN